MTPATILAVLVVVFAVPLNWYVAGRLWWLSRRSPAAWVLRERAIQALATAIIVTVFAAVFVNNEMAVPFLDSEATRVITRAVILTLSVVPALYWLYQVRKA